MIRVHPSFVAAALVALPSLPASATPTFPGVLQTELALATTPSCNACHVGLTSRGTVTTDLGRALLSRGMVAGNEESLRTAIKALVAEQNPAIRALTGGVPATAITPEYGCACAVTGAPARGSFGLLASAIVAGLVLRRRVRSPR
jgi:MYXO-CTERM domain-containing protein